MSSWYGSLVGTCRTGSSPEWCTPTPASTSGSIICTCAARAALSGAADLQTSARYERAKAIQKAAMTAYNDRRSHLRDLVVLSRQALQRRVEHRLDVGSVRVVRQRKLPRPHELRPAPAH